MSIRGARIPFAVVPLGTAMEPVDIQLGSNLSDRLTGLTPRKGGMWVLDSYEVNEQTAKKDRKRRVMIAGGRLPIAIQAANQRTFDVLIPHLSHPVIRGMNQFALPRLSHGNVLDIGFARIPLPDTVKVKVEPLPGEAATGFAHVDLSEIGILVVTQRDDGLDVHAGVAKAAATEDADRRRALFEPIARSVNGAIEAAFHQSRS